MFSESYAVYDLLYRTIKDYAQEAGMLASLIRGVHPHAAKILDVACGTGEHACHLAELGFQVDGVDIEPGFVELAATKNPGGSFVQGDMIDLNLGHRYDVVLCLFSSIGYVKSVENLHRAVESLARHVSPDGIVIVEPSFEPGDLSDNYVSTVTAEEDGRHICRMSHTTVEGTLARIRFEYLVGDADGVRRSREVHELAMFTREEMEGAFRDTGLRSEYDPEGIIGRGLYIARREG